MKSLLLSIATIAISISSYSQTVTCIQAPTDTCNSALCDSNGVGPGPQATGWAYADYTVPSGFQIDSVNASFDRVNQDIYKMFYCPGCSVFNFSTSNIVTGASIVNQYDVWFDVTSENLVGSGILRVFAPTQSDPVFWDSLCISISMTTGQSEISNHEMTSVYPNPTKNTISISGGKGDYVITDVFGRIVKEIRIESKEIQAIDIQKLDSGIYFLVSRESNSTIKIIKQ